MAKGKPVKTLKKKELIHHSFITLSMGASEGCENEGHVQVELTVLCAELFFFLHNVHLQIARDTIVSCA